LEGTVAVETMSSNPMHARRGEGVGEEALKRGAWSVTPTVGLMLLVVFQWSLVAALSFQPVNIFKIRFRQEQRAAVFKALSEEQSPANKAALQEEIRLARRYIERRQLTKAGVLMGIFLCADGIGIYLWRKKTSCPLSPARQ